MNDHDLTITTDMFCVHYVISYSSACIIYIYSVSCDSFVQGASQTDSCSIRATVNINCYQSESVLYSEPH